MPDADVLVVGSGPGAVWAAWGLQGLRVVILDVGFERPDTADRIGGSFESLRNIHERPISLKLKAPGMAHVVRDSDRLAPVASSHFEGAISLAKGGLANAWGAGVYRYNDADLAGFPIRACDLVPFYDEVGCEIGVSGEHDALTRWFGREPALQPALRMTPMFADMLPRLARHGMEVGRPRLAVLSQPHNGRPAYPYDNQEFFTQHPSIYTPAHTLGRLDVEYVSRRLVRTFSESGGEVRLEAMNIDTGAAETWTARALCIGAGALNTSRIVLASNRDTATRLPVFDNPMACFPVFDWRRIGDAMPHQDTSLVQLNAVFQDERGTTLQASIYGASGPLRSDVLFSLPLTVAANATVLKYTAAASALLMLFYPGAPGNYLQLQPDGALRVEFAPTSRRPMEGQIVRTLQRAGYIAHEALTQRPGPGAGLHYAGSLPMRAQPRRYETAVDGRLHGTNAVYIVDGACFSALPSKNLTYTIMANALRIGRGLRERLA